MNKELATLTPTDEVIQSLSEKGITETLIKELVKYSGLEVEASIVNGQVVYNNDQLKKVSDARKQIKNTRVLIEKTCKSFRDVHTQINKEYSAKEKEFVNVLSPVEDALQAEEDKVENLKEQIRIEEEQKQEATFKSRVVELEDLGMQSKDFGQFYALNELKVASVDLKFMPESGYISFLNEVKEEDAKLKEVARLADEKAKAEAAELQRVKDAQEAEAKRLEAIAKEQADKQRQIEEAQARIDAEKKRIADEKEAAEQAKVREQELIKAREEARVKAIADEKARVERERIAAEEKAKADEAARIEAERKAVEKAARKEARKPDVQKLKDFSVSITGIVSPELKSPEADAILSHAVLQLKKVSEFIEQEIEKLNN